ncbi:MAG TPA: S8 family serine peptidase [Solirubrobacteraceae bacterium]|nr:S8 family serine peptidase [Solirubrobacteraceae bacterium]
MLDRDALERWLYGSGPRQRRTQDSPILPDVWYAYALPPWVLDERPPELPLVADDEDGGGPAAESPGPPGEVDLLLRPHADSSAARVAQLLAGRLRRPREETQLAVNEGYVACRATFGELLRDVLPLTPFWQRRLWPGRHGRLADLVGDRVEEIAEQYRGAAPRRQGRRAIRDEELPGNLVWLLGLAGRIAWEHEHAGGDPAALPSAREVVEAALAVLGDAVVGGAPEDAVLWSVSRNRPVAASVWRSRITCKADAATTLFGLSCRDVRWAVVDSGIDARHPAFARRVADAPVETSGTDPRAAAASRVLQTWDFSRIRALLSTTEGEQAQDWVVSGRTVDWEAIAPRLEVGHDDGYTPPADDHGTHVAGILAADWRQEDTPSPGPDHVRGMCPDITLYDLRVFGPSGGSDEFSILSAMQFVRHLNANADRQVVHGVNLSFSLRHEVAKYAAGRTPVCEEAHRLVGAGVVVVAAAGNDGRGGYVVKGRSVEGYRTVAIADPGNAERVITVGATHRERPHTYGVSYFSSRGPTGDGRAKPDLVAPGEKISAPVRDGGLKSEDGTSQAAPHVSGACALLLARHPELIGDPERVKRILMETCTDLGRERAFQGAGMVDVLRALQAV